MHLKLEHLTKRFGRSIVFRDISLDLNPTEYLAVRGSNGSGKSTLLKTMLGVLSPSSGRAVFTRDGKPVEPSDVLMNVGFCAPYLNLYEHLSAEENILFHLNGLGKKPQPTKFQELFDYFQLSNARHKYLKTFSSGMIQRTRLIQALVSDPDILVLDEPTATLDSRGHELLHEYLGSLKAGTDTMVIIASNDNQDLRHCDRELNIENFKP